MAFNIEGYLDQEIQGALNTANLKTAKELWREKDWDTYQEIRMVIGAILRSEHHGLIRIEHYQYVYFISTHLAPRLPQGLTELQMFFREELSEEPYEREWTDKPVGEFWRELHPLLS
jgi:hypothetical protein